MPLSPLDVSEPAVEVLIRGITSILRRGYHKCHQKMRENIGSGKKSTRISNLRSVTRRAFIVISREQIRNGVNPQRVQRQAHECTERATLHVRTIIVCTRVSICDFYGHSIPTVHALTMVNGNNKKNRTCRARHVGTRRARSSS